MLVVPLGADTKHGKLQSIMFVKGAAVLLLASVHERKSTRAFIIKLKRTETEGSSRQPPVLNAPQAEYRSSNPYEPSTPRQVVGDQPNSCYLPFLAFARARRCVGALHAFLQGPMSWSWCGQSRAYTPTKQMPKSIKA
jgi:hypothetical protein